LTNVTVPAAWLKDFGDRRRSTSPDTRKALIRILFKTGFVEETNW
jgi:hypothetical protein